MQLHLKYALIFSLAVLLQCTNAFAPRFIFKKERIYTKDLSIYGHQKSVNLLIPSNGIKSNLRISRMDILKLAALSSSNDDKEQYIQSWDEETDVIVIGSGIGGLTCGSLLTYYGFDVKVLESHYLPGGCAHSFEKDGFTFDSGPSLWNGMATPPYNPLREVMDIMDVGKNVEYKKYPGWGMSIPEGDFFFKVGPKGFDEAIVKFGGPGALNEWNKLLKVLDPLAEISGALPPIAIRSDGWVIFTLLRWLPRSIRAGFSTKLLGPITEVTDPVIKSSFLRNWINFLSFAISGIKGDETLAAAMAYTLRDLNQEGAALDYPVGGSGAIINALVNAISKHSAKDPITNKPKSEVRLNSHVQNIFIEKNKNGETKAVGVKIKQGNKRIRAKKAVVSNASLWDTLKLLPKGTISPTPAFSEETPACESFVHLHLGINATGLPKDLNTHHTVIRDWNPIDKEQNVAIISIPSTLDPNLAPDGCHVVHVYAAGNEPFDIYNDFGPDKKDEYEKMKNDRCEFLWQALEKVIPDVRSRVIVEMKASPLTHKRFLRRYKGTYGPALPAGKISFPGPKTEVKGLYRCGDSVFPGIGVPAVAVSGINAANSIAPVWKHFLMLRKFVKLYENRKT